MHLFTALPSSVGTWDSRLYIQCKQARELVKVGNTLKECAEDMGGFKGKSRSLRSWEQEVLVLFLSSTIHQKDEPKLDLQIWQCGMSRVANEYEMTRRVRPVPQSIGFE